MLNMNNFFMVLAESQNDTENIGTDLIRLIFGTISNFIYGFIAKMTDVLYEIALILNINGDGITKLANSLTDKLFAVILIYMIFRGTITMLNFLVDPDSFQDKAKGGAAFIKRTLITILLLISINPIFNLLGTIQAEIIDSDIITNLFLGTKDDVVVETDDGQRIYYMSMSQNCAEDYLVASFSKGDHLALETLKPFIQPTASANYDTLNALGYCGSSSNYFISGSTESGTYVMADGLHTAESYLVPSVYNSTSGDGWPTDLKYNINFNFFFCLIVGIVVLLILITFVFDVVIRAFNLIILKVLAPVPIIAYMSPKGKDSEMLGTWIKKVISTWISLFIRLIALEFALSIISLVCDGDALRSDSLGLIESLFVICGALMFAKKLPQLLEEIIPGFKGVGNFELNPFKRISNEALGGKALLGLGAGAGALALGAATNGVQRLGETAQNVANAQGAGARARALGSGLLKTAGSTIAGGTRAGINAFNRTRKDGNMFGGLWNGYQVSMYSKLKRDEYIAQGGTGWGALKADFNRFTGTLTEGQREFKRADELNSEIAGYQAQIDANKLVVESEKNKLKPHEMLKTEAAAIKSRLSDLYDKDSNVQAARALKEGYLKSLADADKGVEDARLELNKYLANPDEDAEVAAVRKAQLQANVRAAEVNATNKKKAAPNELKKLQDAIDAAEQEVARNKYTDATLQAHLQNIINLKTEFSSELKDYKPIYTSDGKYNSEEVRKIDNTIARENARIAKYERENIQAYQEEISKIKNSEEYKRVASDKSPAKIENARTFNGEKQAPGTQWHGAVEGGVVEGVPMPGYLDSNGNGRIGGDARARTTGGSGTNPPPPPGGALH